MRKAAGLLDRKLSFLGAALAAALFAYGAYIRLVDLDSNPPGFWQDEASTGLDAFLLWTTGRDRANDLLPIISRSFGDYPLAGYRYLAAPFVGLVGPTIGMERIIAALTGTLMLLSTAAFARRAFGGGVALAALMSAAMCPTWIHFSRYGSEAILLPFCLITSLALIERGRDPAHRLSLWGGAFAAGLAAYTYHAVKLVLPLWTIALAVYLFPFARDLWRNGPRRHVAGPALVFAATVLPSAIAALTPEGTARGRTVLAWYHHQGWELARVVLNNYLTYFDLGMLFVRGGPAVAQSIPGLGLWNLIELPFVLVGLHTLLSGGPQGRLYGFLLFWFLLGPLPGGVTYETHNIGRVIGWLPAPQIVSGIGLWRFAEWIHGSDRKVARAVLCLASAAAWAATAGWVSHQTLVRYPMVTERDWQFEISRSMQCAAGARKKDEQIVVAPQFQAAEVFAKYFFARAPSLSDGRPAWSFGNRGTVGPDELYVFPAGGDLPEGDLVCTIAPRTNPTPRAYVFRGRPGAEAIDDDPPKLEHSGGPRIEVLKDARPAIPVIQRPKKKPRIE